jgi:hypothetical protein
MAAQGFKDHPHRRRRWRRDCGRREIDDHVIGKPAEATSRREELLRFGSVMNPSLVHDMRLAEHPSWCQRGCALAKVGAAGQDRTVDTRFFQPNRLMFAGACQDPPSH